MATTVSQDPMVCLVQRVRSDSRVFLEERESAESQAEHWARQTGYRESRDLEATTDSLGCLDSKAKPETRDPPALLDWTVNQDSRV